MEEIPPDVLTGLGDLRGKSLLGLITSGSGFFPVDWGELALRSNIFTSEVVGAIGVESVGLSVSSFLTLRLYDESRRGFGGTAGLLVTAVRGRVWPLLLPALESREGGGARAVASEAAC